MRRPGRRTIGRLALAAALALVALPAAGASAEPTEAITGGGFESTTCDTTDPIHPQCSNPDWDYTGFQTLACTSAVCGPAAHGDGMLLLGGQMFVNSDESGSVSQTIQLPHGGPWTLSFELKGSDAVGGVGNLGVELDGLTYEVISMEEAPASFEERTVVLPGTAGEHTLSFSIGCSRLFSGPMLHPSCDAFKIDDVSLPVEPATPVASFTASPPPVTARHRVRVAFTADPRDGTTFECRLDRASYEACSSPMHVRAGPGGHRLHVRATSGDGVPSAPILTEWRVRPRGG